MKRVFLKILVCLGFVLTLPWNSGFPAQRMAKGQREFSGGLSFLHQSVSYKGEEEGSITSFILSPKWGFFVDPNLELEPGLLYQLISEKPKGEQRHSTTAVGGTFNLSYNFGGRGQSIPFISGGFGFLLNHRTGARDLNTTLIFPSFSAGMKSFLTKNGALRFEVFYQRWTNSMGIEDLTTDNFGISVGLSVFLE